MSKFNIFLITIFLLASVGLWFTQGSDWPETKIKLGGEKLHVLVAKTNYQQKKGLGGREELTPYDGMLFRFYPDYEVPMVMRDMQFPIDIIWLQNNKVVDIEQNVQPEPDKSEPELTVYKPDQESDMVLEVSAGWVKKNKIKEGDKLKVLK